MALAAKSQKIEREHIAVIGDGAMTGGIAFEGLNHAGMEDTNLLIILNDNCMSIDPAVGALKQYLTDIATSKTYNKAKDKIWKILGEISRFGPNAQKLVQKIESSIKSSLLNESNYFESLNFRYFGPIDGHDLDHLVRTLLEIKKIPGPKILHCLTKKGKGYIPAEKGNSTTWHAPGVFNKETGEIITQKDEKFPKKFQDVFGEAIIELADANKNIVGVTPAMLSGSSLNKMMEVMPNRVFDVGIAEQHAVTFSAGLATSGIIPFCNIYSTFMQRSYDQVIHDVALQKLNIVFCLDRGGLVGADGATHHGAFDLAYFRCIPNMIVSAPMDEEELRNLMYTAQLPNQGPFSIRYPRGKGRMLKIDNLFQEIEVGKGRVIKEGKDLAILSIGSAGALVLESQDYFLDLDLDIAHFDMRFVKPLDTSLLHMIFKRFDKIITVEDGCLQGGFGSAIIEFMSDQKYNTHVSRLGIPDRFINHGTQEELYKECNFDAKSIQECVYKMCIKKEKLKIG